MDLGLLERVFIVTGGSRGLGHATATALIAEGAHVVVSGRDHDRLHQVWSGAAGRAAAVAVDNRDPDAPRRLIDAAVNSFGRLDGALISVGGPPRGTAAAIGDDQWRDSFETIFLGAVRLARAVAARLAPGGAIGFVLSSSVRTPIGGLGISNGLRPGLAAVAKDMADEFGPRGVRVVSLLPGSILTDRLREIHNASGDPEAAAAAASAAAPLRRLGEPEEFGRVAAFLLSPAASYITGSCVLVDGGAVRAL